MYNLFVIYLICLMFLIVSIFCCTFKVKRIVSQNPEFAFIFNKIDGKITINVTLLLLLPIIHLLPLVVYIVLCLMSDEQFIKIFQGIVEKNEALVLKMELKERLQSIDDDEKVTNQLVVYLKGMGIVTSDLNKNVLNLFVDIVQKYIFNEDEISAKKDIVKQLYFMANIMKNEIDMEDLFYQLLKIKNDKELYEKLKNIIKDIYKK